MIPCDAHVLGNPDRGVYEIEYEEVLNWYGTGFDIFCRIFARIHLNFSDIDNQNRLGIFHET